MFAANLANLYVFNTFECSFSPFDHREILMNRYINRNLNSVNTGRRCARDSRVSWAARVAFALAACVFSTSAYAQSETGPAQRWVTPRPATINLGIGYSFGGDELFSATYTDGSEETLSAGQGLTMTVGTTISLWRKNSRSISLGIDAGVKVWNIGADVEDFGLQMLRVPLVLTAHHVWDLSRSMQFNAGMGVQYEVAASLKGSGVAEDLNIDFHDALGYVVKLGFTHWSKRWGSQFTVQLTRIKYESSLFEVIDGKSVGLFITLHYGLGGQ